MAYKDFLREFARAQRVESVEVLLRDFSDRYSFQINSRNRAKDMIEYLKLSHGIEIAGKNVLDIGCAYGSHSIEMIKHGARVVGIDISDKWLKLAEVNAVNEVDAVFLNCDASSRRALNELGKFGSFDLFIVNDVFEHVFDTVGLVRNISKLSSSSSDIYFKVPNGMATRNVLLEGHKKVFGLSLLSPDYWSHYVGAPFHIYYRRWEHFLSIFNYYGFGNIKLTHKVKDKDVEESSRFIEADLLKIKRTLKRKNFDTAAQYVFLSNAFDLYEAEVRDDMRTISLEELYFKYRVTFWVGVASRVKA